MATNGQTSAPLDFTTFLNVIDGKPSSTLGNTRCTVNPWTLENNPEVPSSTLEDVNRAVEAAQKAAKSWAATPWKERASAIHKFADAIESQVEDLAKLVKMEGGKPFMWAQHEISLSVQWLREFCKMDPPGSVIEDTVERKVVTRYTPLGVVVGIMPWNYPILTSAMKLGPAMLTGNAFIWKPSPETPYSSLKIAELATRFFPPGIFQALSGDDSLGPWLTQHPGVNMISFTGSTRVGKHIMGVCSKTMKRLVLELGGNDPAIVCADVDPVSVATNLTFIAFNNSGQICIAVKRVYVHEAIYDAVLAAIVNCAQSLKLGQDDMTSMGPISNRNQYERLKDLLADVERTGLKIATGSTKPASDKTGYFLAPTVIDNPPDNSRIVVEEQFGPILPVLKWSDEADVIRRANATEAGLGASVWSRDTAQAERIADQLQAGNVWINSHAEMQPNIPFAGHKESGFGVEMGVEGLKSYCNVQSVYTKPA
ncbi:aldehyde dehydrogenase [Camillea tinctor]|nr:aldehyde dehydrogenase [Camillea tinctor]